MGLFSGLTDLFGGGGGDGGVGNSKSSSTTNTQSTDSRITGGNDSQNLSVGGNSNNVTFTSTDHGAVSESLRLAMKGIDNTSSLATEVIGMSRAAQSSASSVLSGALNNVSAQNDKLTSAIENVKTSDVRTLIFAGLAVIGLAAVMFVGKKG